ncbi:MAG: hypothetical protein OXE78_11335 [Gammaproteobacteria bacterium]|nr:hypothetical protein [Gammaproteobacteria bacterium]MCY4357980.1 hypothetical protein [Gammaproteobacteria bacterium]
MSIEFDTHKTFKKLTEGNKFSQGQAEVLVETIRFSQGDLAAKTDISEMATKSDIREIKAEFTWMRWILGVFSAAIIALFALQLQLRGDIASVQANVVSVQADVDSLQASVVSVQADVDSLQANIVSLQADVASIHDVLVIQNKAIQSLQALLESRLPP